MINPIRIVTLAAVLAAVNGCAVKGGWMGADAEKKYDQELAATRLAEDRNNDDYYEIHKDGRIYVLSDAKAYKIWLQTDEIPLVVSQIGVGPNGETVKLALIKNEAKAMENKVGFKGAAQQMFEGTLAGMDKNFFGFVKKTDTYFVFDNWQKLATYRRTGAADGLASTGGPDGAKVVFVAEGEAAEKLKERFTKLHQ